MKIVSRWTVYIAVLWCAPAATRAQSTAAVTAPDYWPTRAWRESSPEAQGIESRELAKAFDFIREHRVPVHSLVLVRNGRIVLDATFFPYQSSDLHDLASGTKSVTASLAGIAIGHHQLQGVGQPVLSLFPGRTIANRDSRKEQLSIKSLLTMTSGMACEWMRGETTLDEMRASHDWIQYVLDRPMRDEPGKTFAYCSPGMHLLSASISRSTGISGLDYARRELFQPLGITDAVWPADASGVSHGWGDLHLHPRDMAKLGLLWLSGGRWDGKQVIPADFMRAASRLHSSHMGEGYGYGMWVYPDRQPPIFEANGRGGQRISVVPSANLIAVMAGGGFEPGDIGSFIIKAIKSDHALPEDPAAKAVLDSAVARAARPATAQVVAKLPPMAAAVSGKRWVLEANPLGLKALMLTFDSTIDAGVRLEFADGRVEQRPLGLDGVPRISPNGRHNLPVAVSGAWDSENTFILDYDEVANINYFDVRLTISGREMTVLLSERSDNSHLTFRGHEDGAPPPATHFSPVLRAPGEQH